MGDIRMKTFALCLLLLSSYSYGMNPELIEQIRQQFPEVVVEKEVYSASEISNAAKRPPKATKEVSVDQDLLMLKMLKKLNDQQIEIAHLKKISAK